jgi:hypothetical protein
MKANGILLFSVIIFLLSCEKKNIETADYTVQIEDYSSMDVNAYDTIINLDYGFNPYSMDMDDDGTDDLRISYKDGVIRSNDYFMSGVIECLDQNTFLSIITKTDTTFYEYLADTTRDGRVVISTNSIYHCENNTGKLSVSGTEKNYHLKDYYKGDTISPGYEWISGTFTMVNFTDEPFQDYWDYFNSDTVWLHFETSYKDCYFLPVNQVVFIGVKKTQGERVRLGWIKLAIVQNYSKSLYISESAIQK